MHWAAITTPPKQIYIKKIQYYRVLICKSLVSMRVNRPLKSILFQTLDQDIISSLSSLVFVLIQYPNFSNLLPVVLHGCETWSLTLRKECRVRVFENKIPRRISGPKRDENGKWRRLHNEELHSLYRSPNIVRVIKSRRLRWAGRVARMEKGGSGFKVFTGKPIGKRFLGRPRRRWEDNIRRTLKK